MTRSNGRFWIKKVKRKDHDGPDRAVLLCRQSLTRAGSISLEDQEHTNQKYANAQGYETVEVLRSPNLKGWKEERADHDAILALAAQSGVEVVISYDVSRTARTVRKMEMLAHDLEQLGVRLEFSAQPFANTAQGRQLIATFAELETTSRSIRLTDAWAYLRNQGRWHGVAPFGYRRLDKTIVIDEAEAPIVRMIYGWAVTGKGTTWISNELMNTRVPTRNGGTWGQVHLSRLLRNPAYAGGMRIDGQIVFPPDGLQWHEGIMTRADWEAVQSILPDRPVVIRRKPVNSWIEGLIEHACAPGTRMHLIGTMTPRGVLLPVFRCARRYKPPKCGVIHSEVSAKNVETAVKQAVLSDLFSVPSVDEIQRELVTAQKANGSLMARRLILRAQDALRAERERAESLHLSGRRTRSWFDEQDDRIAIDQRVLRDEEQALPQPDDLAALYAAAAMVSKLATIAEEAPDEHIGSVLRNLGAVAVVGEGGVTIHYPSPFHHFIRCPVTVKIPRARTR